MNVYSLLIIFIAYICTGQSTRGNKDESTEGADSMELKKRAQNLRVTLERLRLLAELVAKREKMKRELWKIKRKVFEQQVYGPS